MLVINLLVMAVCMNKGCLKEIDDKPCVHHPGAPVFHEGFKVPKLTKSWSCCAKRRVTDFGAFLAVCTH